jgi:hypothetical protein
MANHAVDIFQGELNFPFNEVANTVEAALHPISGLPHHSMVVAEYDSYHQGTRNALRASKFKQTLHFA